MNKFTRSRIQKGLSEDDIGHVGRIHQDEYDAFPSADFFRNADGKNHNRNAKHDKHVNKQMRICKFDRIDYA